VTEQGQALRFSEKEVRSMGRQAGGVIGIRTRGVDKLAGMEVVEPGGDLLQVTIKGYGKRTPLSAYPPKGRGTGGVLTISKKAIPEVGRIATARVVQEADDLTIISSNGVVLRTNVKQISQAGRATRGVRIMDIKEGDSVASLARISYADLQRVGATEE